MSFVFDIAAVKQECEEFFSLYNIMDDKTLEMCTRKKIHTRAVADSCRFIAEYLELTPYDCDLAFVIGELHDFARFGQAAVTRSFKDTDRYNHAKMAVRLLFTHRLIEDIIPDYAKLPVDDRLVLEKAIYHHSDLSLPRGLTEREKLFCNIIREADRIDIFRTVSENRWETIYGCDRNTVYASVISEDVLSAFENRRLVNYSKCKTVADRHLGHIALCFGLKSRAAIKRAVEQGYLFKLLDGRFSDRLTQKRFERAAESVRAYCLSGNEKNQE